MFNLLQITLKVFVINTIVYSLQNLEIYSWFMYHNGFPRALMGDRVNAAPGAR